MKIPFSPANFYLPDFTRVDGTAFSVIACDQFTSEKSYWQEVEKIVGDKPSALHQILPEAFLGEDERLPKIHASIEETLKSDLVEFPNALIYLRRTQSDGKIRHGIVGQIDLEQYSFDVTKKAEIMCTEKTVLSRIPPRVKVRRDALLEYSHVMLLFEDKEKQVIAEIENNISSCKEIYHFPLMLKGGEVQGFLLTNALAEKVLLLLDNLCGSKTPMFAVGDGNHSLATAKTVYEDLKQKIGDKALSHPARYASVELVNLYDKALDFEPIYRVLLHANHTAFLSHLQKYCKKGKGKQSFTLVTGDKKEEYSFTNPTKDIVCGSVDDLIASFGEGEEDYIHGTTSLEKVVNEQNAIGFLFDGITKEELFPYVQKNGPYPRKTFSMGHAEDKRYYLEARIIK